MRRVSTHRKGLWFCGLIFYKEETSEQGKNSTSDADKTEKTGTNTVSKNNVSAEGETSKEADSQTPRPIKGRGLGNDGNIIPKPKNFMG